MHDVEPATFERCALIRDWLDDLGVERVTLLVIPAPQLHPFPARSPELANWLLDRVDAGDAVAQHGLQHRRTRRPSPLAAAAARLAGRRRRRVPRARRRGHDRLGRRRPQRPHARRPARRAGSSRPATPTRPRCASTWRRASTGGRRCSRCAATRARTAPALCLGHEQRAQARGLARARPRRRGALRAACCGSTCTPPTSTTRATCSRSSGCCRRAADARRGHLRRPVLDAAGGGRPARELARGHPPRRHPVRASPARRRGATSTSGTGTRAFTRSPGRTSTAQRAKEELRTLLRAGRARRLRPAHGVLAGVAALAARAAVRDRSTSAATPAPQSIQTPLLAVAWERVADGDRRVPSRRASRRSPRTRAG